MKKKLTIEISDNPNLFQIIEILKLIDLQVEETKIPKEIKKFFK